MLISSTSDLTPRKGRSRCAAVGCDVSRKTNPSLRFFSFPLNPERYKKWCSVAGIKDDGWKSRFLCERHFGADQFRCHGLVFKENPRYPTGPLNIALGNYAPDKSASCKTPYLPETKVSMVPSTSTSVTAPSTPLEPCTSIEIKVPSISTRTFAETPSTSTPIGETSISIPVAARRTSTPATKPSTSTLVETRSTSTPVIEKNTSTCARSTSNITPAEASLMSDIFHSYCRRKDDSPPTEYIESLEVDSAGELVAGSDRRKEGSILHSSQPPETQTFSTVCGEMGMGPSNICESVSEVDVSLADTCEDSVSDVDGSPGDVCEDSMSDVHEPQTILDDSASENVTLETPSYVEPSRKEVAEAARKIQKECLDVPCQEITDVLLKDKEEDSENNNTLQPELPIAKPHFIKVLGQQNFQDPSVIKSVLDKVKLKKKGSVFVLPVKKNCNLTRNKLEKIIEELPSENIDVKQRLLTLVRGKSSLGDNKFIPKVKKASQQKRIRKTSRVRKRVRGGKTKVSPALKVRIDASSLRENSQQSSDPKSFTDFTSSFTVSTILTDINDKSQIEQLCQLLIQSLFKVKNLNVNGTMSKIEIYLMQSSKIFIEGNLDNDEKHCEEVWENNQAREKKKQNEVPETLKNTSIISEPSIAISECLEIPSVDTSACTKSVPQSEETPLDGKANITVSQDHAYLSEERKTFFVKPPYLVNIINIDRDKPKKNTQINARPSKTLSKKHQIQFLKQRRHIARLKDFLKKKTDYVENIKFKVKYLRLVLCKKFGVKRVRYPQLNKAHVPSENHPLEGNEYDPGQDDENAQSEIDTAVLNIYPTSELEKREKKPKRKSEKEKIILTPDFVVPPARKRRRKKSLVEVVETNIETSEVDFDTRFDLFHKSLINE